MKNFYLSVVLFFVSYASFSQSRFLDKTFANDGIAITNFGNSSALYSLAVQSDGKVVAAGTFNYADFAVARYNVNGSPDHTFGTNGKVVTDLGNKEIARSVAVQPDGKIVVAGYTQTGVYPDIFSSIAVVRYNADGTSDNSFGTNGKIITNVQQQTFAYAMALQADGKIVVTGSSSDDGNEINLLTVRYNTNGTLDNTFGNAGIATNNFLFENKGYAIALQPDGKVIVAGETYDGASNSTDGLLVRYKPNGTLDSSFSSSGALITYSGVNLGLALQQDGKILVAGWAYDDNYNPEGYVKRENPDGSKDTSFNHHGVVSGGYYAGFNSIAYSVAAQADGKVAVSVYRTGDYPEHKKFTGVIRLTNTGSADLTFGNNGAVAVSNDQLSYTYPVTNPIAINPDGKILLATTFSNNFAVARILAGNTTAVAGIQPKNILNIRVYPNPVISNLNVDGLDKTLPAVITIADVSGNVMMQQKIAAGTNSINVAALKQGRYIAVFTQNNRSGSVKFIKQ